MSFLICLFWRKILSPYCLTEPFEARLVFFVPLLEIKKFGIVFEDVAGHRMVLESRARYEEKTARQILGEILETVPSPKVEG